MIGTKLSDLKKHKALIPLYVCVGVGLACAFTYTARLAFLNPDVSWKNKEGQISNDEYAKKQYKFLSPNLDYSKIESPAPKY